MAPDLSRPRSRLRRAGLVRAPWIAACTSAALLVGVAVDGHARDPEIDTAEFHARVQSAVLRLPQRLGGWTGSNQTTPSEALSILNPNAILNRRYRHAGTGETVMLLFVHCSDARDLGGHYPPVCYPANGLTAGPEEPREWRVGELTIPATRYRFVDARLTAPSETIVDNFMVVPVGGLFPDLTGVQAAARDRRKRVYGAAQVQIVTTGAMGEERRDEVVREFVEYALPLIHSLKVEGRRD